MKPLRLIGYLILVVGNFLPASKSRIKIGKYVRRIGVKFFYKNVGKMST